MSDAKKPYGNKGRNLVRAVVTPVQNSVTGQKNRVAGLKNRVAGRKIRVAALCCLIVLMALVAADSEPSRRAVERVSLAVQAPPAVDNGGKREGAMEGSGHYNPRLRIKRLGRESYRAGRRRFLASARLSQPRRGGGGGRLARSRFAIADTPDRRRRVR